MRPKIYSFYANSFGVNMEECEIQDLHQYKNLSEFFVRPLKEECRPIDGDRNCVVSVKKILCQSQNHIILTILIKKEEL